MVLPESCRWLIEIVALIHKLLLGQGWVGMRWETQKSSSGRVKGEGAEDGDQPPEQRSHFMWTPSFYPQGAQREWSVLL